VTGNWGWAIVPDTSPIQSPDYQDFSYRQGPYTNPADWNNYDTSAAPMTMIGQPTNFTEYGQPSYSQLVISPSADLISFEDPAQAFQAMQPYTQQTISPSAGLISFGDPAQAFQENVQQVNNYDDQQENVQQVNNYDDYLLYYDQRIVEVAKQLWQSNMESCDNTASTFPYLQDHDSPINNEIYKQENNTGFYNPANYSSSEWNQSGNPSCAINQPSSVFDYGQPSIFNPSNDVSAISTNTLESNQYHPEYNWYIPK